MSSATLTLTQFIESVSDGTIFSVDFVKRTTGEIRHMVCRRGVTKHLKGGELGYNAKEKDLLSVFDMQKNGYRMISLDSLITLKCHGAEYVWKK